MRHPSRLTCLVAALALACADPGKDGKDGTSDTDDTDTDDTEDTEDTTETDPPVDAAPTVLSITPEDDATGVFPTQMIAITFSEPMDTASVEAAFSMPALEDRGYDFIWSDDTILNVAVHEGLPAYNALELFEGLLVELEIGTGATDAGGTPLEAAFTSSFRVARSLTRYLAYEDALTGLMNSNGTTSTAANEFFVGDVALDYGNRVVASFDLSFVPEGVLSAKGVLYFDVLDKDGDPLPVLGPMVVELVSSDTLEGLYDKEPVVPDVVTVVAKDAHFPEEQVDVSTLLKAAIDHREDLGDFAQFRMRLTEETDEDGEADLLRMVKSEDLALEVDLLLE